MIYLDPSVIYSLYAMDANTANALALVRNAAESLLLTPFCELETFNAFSLAQFRGELSEYEVSRLRRDFEADLGADLYQLRPVPDGAFLRARFLTLKITPSVGVRAADLLHVAIALELGAKALYTLDIRQHTAAQAAGLKVNALPGPSPQP